MKVKILGIAIALGSLLIPQAARAEWIHLTTSEQGDRVYINDSTITRVGNYATFGVVGESSNSRIAMILTANCATGQFQKQDLVEDGRQIRPVSGHFPIQQATMGSLYGAAVQYACGSH
jgi:hypothetical protein